MGILVLFLRQYFNLWIKYDSQNHSPCPGHWYNIFLSGEVSVQKTTKCQMNTTIQLQYLIRWSNTMTWVHLYPAPIAPYIEKMLLKRWHCQWLWLYIFCLNVGAKGSLIMKIPSIKPSPCKIHYIEAWLPKEINLNVGKWTGKINREEEVQLQKNPKGDIYKKKLPTVYCWPGTDGWKVSITIKQMINYWKKMYRTAYISEFAKRLRCAGGLPAATC